MTLVERLKDWLDSEPRSMCEAYDLILEAANLNSGFKPCGCGKPVIYMLGDLMSCNKHKVCLTYIEQAQRIEELEDDIEGYKINDKTLRTAISKAAEALEGWGL